MLSLLISLGIIGLLSIDPIGIAIMPILLVQEKPLSRSLAFLGGSFTAIVIIGFLVARYLGRLILSISHSYGWTIPIIEFIAGLALLAVAISLYLQKNHGKSIKPSQSLVNRLQFNIAFIYLIGVSIITIQTLVDIVFVVAMIRVGQLKLSNIDLSVAVIIYALSSLLLQLSVVIAFILTPKKHKGKTLRTVDYILNHYANTMLTIVCGLIGFGLLIVALIGK